jgi:hypothetical protein
MLHTPSNFNTVRRKFRNTPLIWFLPQFFLLHSPSNVTHPFCNFAVKSNIDTFFFSLWSSFFVFPNLTLSLYFIDVSPPPISHHHRYLSLTDISPSSISLRLQSLSIFDGSSIHLQFLFLFLLSLESQKP